MIGIVNYGAGNIFSLTAALDRLNISYGMINTETDFDSYDRIIIPGVGHAGTAMKKLEDTGLVPKIKGLTKPVLGICVGMQLLTDFGASPSLNLLKCYERDDEFDFITTDVYSYHVDRSPIAADNFLYLN